MLADPVWPAGTSLIVLGDIDSTNAEAHRRAAEGTTGPVWITSRRQLTGRARRGRNWVSEAGNLYASLLMPFDGELRSAGTLPLVAALAVHRAIAGVLPQADERLRLKWPNDVLISGAKVNGILLESVPRPERLSIIIGCGINCAHHPENPAYPATNLAAEGADVDPDGLLPRLAAEMKDALAIWNMGKGFPTIRDLWLERAQGVGQPVRINYEDRTITGLFAGLDMDGYLMLEEPTGNLTRISAGDLFFSSGN